MNRRGFFQSVTAAGVAAGLFSRRTLTAQTRLAGKKMNLSFTPLDLKLRYPFTLANFSRTSTPAVLVEIEYDGLTGYGEAALPPYLGESKASVCDFLGRVDLAQFKSPFELEEILADVDALAENNTAAKASIDIALHDLVGKIMGLPWYQIWGLSLDKIPPTTYTIGIDQPDVVVQKTGEAAERFRILKVKLGRDNDKEMIETIRTVTHLPISVDANQGWTDKVAALEMIHWLKERGVVMVEQPMSKRQLDDTAWITERSPLPIFADESVWRLYDVAGLKQAFHGINIKLMKCTGMREAWKMATLAKALGMKIMLGCMTETSCAIAAAAHLSPVADFTDLDGNFLIADDVFTGVRLIEGRQIPSDAPGLGIVKKIV